MGCQYFEPCEHGANSFTVAMPKLTFGRGCLAEVGVRLSAQSLKRVAVFTDAGLLNTAILDTVRQSLTTANIDFAIFHDVRVEPCDDTVTRAAAFYASGNFAGAVSVGGGSVMDTAKAALAVATHNIPVLDYFAKPIGGGKPVPGPLPYHVACPTTSGTGSESTSLSVLRINALNTKFVIASPWMLPDVALVDPANCDSLPGNVVASTGFDLLCHALECYTAKAYTKWPQVNDPNSRQLIQGANPFSDLAAPAALRIADQYLVRGVADASDHVARDQLMWGATLAGIAFGNSGTHLPHAMSYGITHLMNNITTRDYAMASPFVPHGISVIVNAPAIFEYTASATPERHLEGASFLGADTQSAAPDDAGEILSKRLIDLMRDTQMPNGLQELGFTESDVSPMAESSYRQTRAIANAPRDSNLVDLENIYTSSLSYW